MKETKIMLKTSQWWACIQVYYKTARWEFKYEQ